ncbi:hypothetical protein PMG25_01270 [Roseofilum sp. BLCC_M114]|uniref:Uncharacterized protein n=1 Tax=Roseofilum capinflatum BLCC-M114 TaxID=3022440 RepID=A0ABT7B0Q0_9CYAN|nr:hypothetical protein [Roseofilum capinflatum]MDJ1172720.1 hypothetical protein [Roseofilum capinflatum BLCC-M114]
MIDYLDQREYGVVHSAHGYKSKSDKLQILKQLALKQDSSFNID